MEYFRDRFISELNDEGEIEIRGFRWPRETVLREMDSDGYIEAFDEWVGQAKEQAKERVKDFLTSLGCIERFRRLCTRVRANSVVPWVGAGLSIPSGFAGWADFLRGLTADAPEIRDQMEILLREGQFEAAAQLIVDHFNINTLNEEIENRFGHRTENPVGPIRLLPAVFGTGCITTNFDYLLERVYELDGKPFRRTFAGAGLRDAPRRAADEAHCLFRIHGEADTDTGRILTLDEYNSAYGNTGTLAGLLDALITNRHILFMGASLSTDRTLSSLSELKAQAAVQTPRHYAFLPVPPPKPTFRTTS